MTSSGEESDVTEVPAIRIPTGQSITPASQQDCEQSDNVSVTLTVTDFDGNKDQSDQVFQGSDTEDTDPEAMVRVRRPITCRHAGVSVDDKGQGKTVTVMTPAPNDLCPCGGWGEREEGRLTPVADLLMSDPLDVTEAEIEAVPLEQHFYNQWARLPREEDPDSDVTTGTRRSASLRMPSATGSIKSYTLMHAIARDKTSPIDNYAGLVHYMKTGAGGDGSFNSPARRGPSLADAHRTCPGGGGSKSAIIPGRAGDGLPPILRARTALGTTTRPEQTCPQRSCSVQTSPRSDRDRYSSFSSAAAAAYPVVDSACQEDDGEVSSCCSSDDKKLLSMPRFLSKKDRSLTSVGGQSKHSRCPPKSLSLNIASLLFSEELDGKSGYRQQITQKRPQTTTKQQRNRSKNEYDLSKIPSSNKNKNGGGDTKSKPPEMTCVEFIDLAEVKKLLLKDGRSQESKETAPGNATERAGLVHTPKTDIVFTPSQQRVACSAAQRHYGGKTFGKLYDGRNASTSVGLPLTISAVVSSAE
ncbi:hypothetical protein ACOMHN_052436 [Nucella lapillus]